MDVNQRAQLGKEKRLCFSCFESTDHQSRDCTRKKRCNMEGCDKYHHPLIHGAAPVFVGMPSVNNPPPVPPLNAAAPVFVGASSVNCVPTPFHADRTDSSCDPKGVKVSTFALLDSGSQTSLILENFADAIGLDSENGPLQLDTINSSGRPVRSRKVSFHVGAPGRGGVRSQCPDSCRRSLDRTTVKPAPTKGYSCHDTGFSAPEQSEYS